MAVIELFCDFFTITQLLISFPGEYTEEGLLGVHQEEDDEDDENTSIHNTSRARNTHSTSPSSRQLPKLPGGGGRRQLPQPGGGGGNTYDGPAATGGPAGNRGTNNGQVGGQGENLEPIVFYSEDNEFAYKNE